MDMRIMVLSVVLSFFLGVSSQAGLLDTKTLPGTQPQTPAGAQQVPRGTTINPLEMRVEAIGEQDFGASGRVAGGKKTPEKGQMTPAQLLIKAPSSSRR